MTAEDFAKLSLREMAPIYRQLMRENRHRLTWIYTIQQGDDGPVKIGKAKKPSERIATLQQANPATLNGIAAWRDFPEEEKRLHREFAKYRIRGEWFEPAPELIEYVTHEGGSFCDWTPLTKDEREGFGV
jgi:hypothetical protein